MTAKQAKAPAKKQSSNTARPPRRLKKPQYNSFRLHKKIKVHYQPIAKVRSVLRASLAIVKKQPRVFAGIVIVYIVLGLVLVRNFQSLFDLPSIKSTLGEYYDGATGKTVASLALFGVLISSGNTSGATANASVYQTIITLMTALAVVWVVRHHAVAYRLRIRDGFYRGMYPLIPLIGVLMVISLQLIPLAVAGWLYSTVIVGGIAVAAIEVVLWAILILLLATLSLYMVTSSIFALVIVTLPDMTPLRALRSARQLVLHRRWQVVRHVIAFCLLSVCVLGLVMLPFLLWLTAIAEWVFFVLSACLAVWAVVYVYSLYTELLHE